MLFCAVNGLTINFNFRYFDAYLTDKLLTPLTCLSNGLTVNVVNILVNGAHLWWTEAALFIEKGKKRFILGNKPSILAISWPNGL